MQFHSHIHMDVCVCASIGNGAEKKEHRKNVEHIHSSFFFFHFFVCHELRGSSDSTTVGNATTMKRNPICARTKFTHRHTQAILVFERIHFAFLAFSCCCFNHKILRRRTNERRTRSADSYRVAAQHSVLRAWIVLLWKRCSYASIITAIIVITYFPSFRVRCSKAREYFWRKNR